MSTARHLTEDELEEQQRIAAAVAQARGEADRLYDEQVQRWRVLVADGVSKTELARASGLKNSMSINYAFDRRPAKV